MKNTTFIPSVNFHLTKACNMKCKYCFAEFRQVKHQINLMTSMTIIKLLWDFGFKKINFVGGEPFLINGFSQLLKYSKKLGFYNSIVTNGSFINKSFLEANYKYIDIIGISVDSLNQATNKQIGRHTKEIFPDINYYGEICKLTSDYGIDLKINTVVSKFNINEDFTDFIKTVNPIRWKVFQVLEIENENSIKDVKISIEEFETFINRHNSVKEVLIKENNNVIKGSYVMINPEGCFYDNSKGRYTVSEPVMEVGVPKALDQVNFDYSKFIERNGNYYENLTNKQLAS